MNELMITFDGGNYLYYKTYEEPVACAVYELKRNLAEAGVNWDNMKPVKAVLRDSEGNDIDEEVYR